MKNKEIHLKRGKKVHTRNLKDKTKQNLLGPGLLAWCWIIQRWICSCFISVGPSCQHWLDYCQSIVLQSSEPLQMFKREVVVFWGFFCDVFCMQTLENLYLAFGHNYRERSSLHSAQFFFSTFASRLGSPNFYLQPLWPLLSGEWSTARVPCVALPAAR